MQSQQKKVKWSRGETADALEERTDTGITQVSVSKLENIIADIYGNISRRPALKVVESEAGATDIPVVVGTNSSTPFLQPPQSFVFTVNANEYIIFVADSIINAFGGLLIRNNKFVKRVKITNTTGWTPNYWLGKRISAAQYNNFMVVSNLYIGDVIFRLDANNDIIVEKFQFSAPWYAPNGTQSITVSNADLIGLEFNSDGQGFTAFAWTDESGISSPYSLIDTGLNGLTQAIEEKIPVGSIVKFPNMGAYMRVEGFRVGGHTVYFPDITFDTKGSASDPIPSTGWHIQMAGANIGDYVLFKAYHNGTYISQVKAAYDYNTEYWFQSSTSASGYIKITPQGWNWTDVPAGTLDVQMFGPLLTPVANGSNKDTVVTVETGYISLDTYTPKQFEFSNQRLYVAGFENPDASPAIIPGYAVGSQIARYNDFKNDYNTANEAVSIDISTSYQEQIVALIDYNGLKILTDAAEYSFTEGAVVKQSENGSLASCKPIVFGSVCLYADKSGGQIRAMQYELQSDQFGSSSINQMTQEDLIFNTNTLVGFYDKENHAGHFLFATQVGYTGITQHNPIANHTIAVCNLVPGNQAMIWGRWTTPDTKATDGTTRHLVSAVVEVNNKVWFIFGCQHYAGIYQYPGYTIAELDYDNLMDIETQAVSTDTQYQIIAPTREHSLYAWKDDNNPTLIVYSRTLTPGAGDPLYDEFDMVYPGATVQSVTGTTLTYDLVGTPRTATYTNSADILAEYATLPRATISVFDGDEYKWDDTLDDSGSYTKSLTELTNPRVGFMINATLESHPIDVGGRTYTDHKRIGKAVAVIHDTEPNAFTVCDKTGYTSTDKKKVNFYGCTGMKDQIRYTIKNIQGAKFSIESLTMIIEYATLDS